MAIKGLCVLYKCFGAASFVSINAFDRSTNTFIKGKRVLSFMPSEKIARIMNALASAAYIIVSALFSDFSNNLYVAKYRWKATRERYEDSLTNSVSIPRLHNTFSNVHDSLGQIFDALLIIVFGSALITTVANSTTGSAAKNGNVTASPGATAIIQLLPFIFVAIIAFSAFDLLRSRRGMG